jgi:lipoate-protein ligase A
LIKLFHLRHIDWLDSQLIYHALPRLGMEGLLILAPSSPYVCIGYHQNLEQEVDLAYCRDHDIPVFRREVGGGAVFLDGNQLFYQLILHKDHPLAGGSKADFYQRLLQPVVDTYQELGIDARYRPVNDIITTEGRKIAGTGAAEIDDHVILVGNLIADFDYETMTKVLKVPDEKFRDKIFKSLTENLTTIKRELGSMPTWDEMAEPLIRHYEKVLGPFNESQVSDSIREKVEEIKPRYLNDEWLFMKRRNQTHRDIKIATDVNVIQHNHKAPGGLMKAVFELKDEMIKDLSLSGDYFCYPSDLDRQIEELIEGKKFNEITGILEDFYNQNEIETPGITPADWAKVIIG